MKKILLIEDNDDVRENTAEILELANYQVFSADNGKTGLEAAIAQRPDLIICDIMMPELDGYGVLHGVHRNEAIKNVPFIFLTAKTERSDYRKGMDMGADDFITKPFSGSELLNAVDSRLKKITMLKEELASGLEGMSHLLSVAAGERNLKEFTEDRNINRFKKKQIIYLEGNHPQRLYYILKGKVKAYKTNEDGRVLVTDLFSPGDFLGHTALLEGSIYHDTAEALEESEIAVIPREEFDELLATNPEVARKFIRLLAKNISEKEDQLLHLAYNSLRRKVADALLTLQKKYRQNSDEPFAISISRESLATVAGTATESLIRTLSDFRDEKIVDIKEGSIIILNEKKLTTLVN